MEERLAKFLSRCGVASRRKAEELVLNGQVSVNGSVALDLRHKVRPGHDKVSVDGCRVHAPGRLSYIALNKPRGYISDLADPRGRKLARDLIESKVKLFPVGRLDYSSDGLMFFTNDGEFANKVMHPRYGVEKEYLVKLRGTLTEGELALLVKGITLEARMYRAKRITPVKASHVNYWYRIVVTEGRNRMIRKMADAIHHPVLKLSRVRIGPVRLGTLQSGLSRPLTEKELRDLTGSDHSET
jgi:23S rRNA pseudouridine2605 synthase